MLDAFGKPGSDLLNFQTKWIGSYDECVALQSKNNYQAINGWSAVPDEFSAKYCTISFGLEQGALVRILYFIYFIYLKYPESLSSYRACPKIRTSPIHYLFACLNSAGSVANSIDPDQTPRSAASDQGLYCLFRPANSTHAV